MKSRCRSWSASGALALGAITASGATWADDAGAWFGPACATASTPAPAEALLLLSARHRPDQGGADVRVLQTADGQLWSDATDLQGWQLPLPAKSLQRRGHTWYALAAIGGLRYRHDACTQTLWIDNSGIARDAAQYDLSQSPYRRVQPMAIDPGGYLNLDLQAQDSNVGRARFSGIADLGFFGIGSGYGQTGTLVDDDRVTRLDSSWSVDDQRRLRRFTVGDSVLRPSQFGLPARFGGLQYGTAFDVRPDIVTFPQPTLQGNAALPSSVDVYVNQTLRSRQDVAAGPFALSNIPAVVGLDRVQIVTTDVLGRQQVVSYPLYAAQTLLKPGLSDFTVEGGWLRQQYGLRSDDYGAFASAATWRRGLSDTLTIETRGEAASEHALLSQGANWLLPRLGVFNAGVAASQAHGAVGAAGTAGFQRITSRWSLSLQSYRADADFVRNGEQYDALRANDVASIGVAMARGGSLSLSHVQQRRSGSGDSTVDSLGYNITPWRDLYVSATWSQISEPQHDYSVALFFGYQFGNNRSAYASLQRSRGGELQQQYSLQKNMAGTLGTAYQLSVGEGTTRERRLLGDWATTRGNASIDVSQYGDSEGVRLGYRTGIAFVRDDAFWTRPVRGGFAVVDTSGIAGVTVLSEGQPVGRTNAAGRLLLPDLRAYEENRVRIDELDLPMSATLESNARSVILPSRGATHLLFPIRQTRRLRLRLKLANGEAVPAGAALQVDGAAALPVGYDGAVYVESVGSGARLIAQWSGHRCSALIPAGLSSSARSDLRCEEQDAAPGTAAPPRFQLATTLSARVAGLSLRLWLAHARPVPAGAQLIADGEPLAVQVGANGAARLDQVPLRNEIFAQWPGHRCRAAWNPKNIARDPLDLRCQLDSAAADDSNRSDP